MFTFAFVNVRAAVRVRGRVQGPIRQQHRAEVKSYYASVSGYKDVLLWAALWLHRATGKASYLDYVVDNAHDFGGTGWAITEFSWDVKYAGVQILAARLLVRGEHTADQKRTLEQYRPRRSTTCARAWAGTRPAARTPTWSGAREGCSLHPAVEQHAVRDQRGVPAVHLRRLPGRGRRGDRDLRGRRDGGRPGAREVAALARAQVDYVLGTNPRGVSYLVGYGAKYPARVHHRAASIVPYKHSKQFIGCTQGFDHWFGRRSSNPNVLVGAIVGGPDRRDRFRDNRDNYMQTEACTYNTAPMVGMFAKLNRMAREEREQRVATARSSTVASKAAEV